MTRKKILCTWAHFHRNTVPLEIDFFASLLVYQRKNEQGNVGQRDKRRQKAASRESIDWKVLAMKPGKGKCVKNNA